jgi:hypothetical protein
MQNFNNYLLPFKELDEEQNPQNNPTSNFHPLLCKSSEKSSSSLFLNLQVDVLLITDGLSVLYIRTINKTIDRDGIKVYCIRR